MKKCELEAYIEKKNSLGSVPGLDNINELMRRLGNPERSVPVLHIAGTNGKGSIFAYVENVLMKAGLVAGRFISPAIFEFNEMFQINQSYITDEELCEVMDIVKAAADAMEAETGLIPTAFEIETAAAFVFFKLEKVDVALVECGMGGRLDATNLNYERNINVLSSISYDHMTFLGNTLKDIAREKLGICKEGDVLVSYPLLPEAANVKDEIKEKLGLSVYDADVEKLHIVGESLRGSEFIYDKKEYKLRMSGNYQILNAITALEVINAINANSKYLGIPEISYENTYEGLMSTVWPGRFTVIGDEPTFIVDGAHNEDAWRLLYENLNKYFTKKSIIYIIGVLKDKDYDKMLHYLTPTMKYAFTLTPPNPVRALDKDALRLLIEEAGVEAMSCDNVKEAIAKAEEMAGEDGVVCCCGTLSFVGEVLREKDFTV